MLKKKIKKNEHDQLAIIQCYVTKISNETFYINTFLQMSM